jgi:hypothetical protein|uniref:DUF5672 domain-containing protein n=1 Tax=viral metagenome TaxID=1070528 RepID=A0A6C0IM27_9ZZZZ
MKLTSYQLLFILCCLIVVGVTIQSYVGKNIEHMSQKYTAIIVEPREHKALTFVLDNFCSNLDENWTIVVLHGNQNENFIQSKLENELTRHKHRIRLNNLGVNNLSLDDYNKLLTSPQFYSYIDTEQFLIFQTDTMICEDYKDLIYEFMEYDYVGAPNTEWVGNGGLSLRKKSKMMEIINNNTRPFDENEDVFFTNPKHNLKIPTIEIANRFSNENIYSDKSFGVHKPWNYLSEEDLKNKEMKCKGLHKLRELNN